MGNLVTLKLDIETITGGTCDSCGALVNLDDVSSPLYECGGCGTTFTRENSYDGGSTRCPDCRKFSAKIAEHGCPECNQGQLEETNGYTCPECDEVCSADDIASHLAEHLRANLVESDVEPLA